ncbi:Uncharacterised protein [Mycobacterium tuberculosis]|nr:Uncharacterised protein [Mycobacterium tuberculosis]
MTEYETKFYEKGMPIHRLEVVIGKKALSEHLRQLEAGVSGQE